MTWHAYNPCNTVYTHSHPDIHPRHPSCASTCSASANWFQYNSNQSPPARDARYVQLWNHRGEPAHSPSKQQSQQAFAHVCLTFPLLFQNKVLKQQGKGSVNGSVRVRRNHQPCCFQLCSHCRNQWKHLAVMSTYRQEKHPILYAMAVSSSRPTSESRSLTAPGGLERAGV